MAKGIIFINEEKCKSCELCVSVCPKKILEITTERINSKGYYPSMITDMDSCIACMSCGRICPEIAITIGKQ